MGRVRKTSIDVNVILKLQVSFFRQFILALRRKHAIRPSGRVDCIIKRRRSVSRIIRDSKLLAAFVCTRREDKRRKENSVNRGNNTYKIEPK